MSGWIVKQNDDFSYEIKCPECGHSFRSMSIDVRRGCDQCGATITDRDRTFRIGRSGELVEGKGHSKRNNRADDHHQDVTAETEPAGLSFFRKFRKIICAGGCERD